LGIASFDRVHGERFFVTEIRLTAAWVTAQMAGAIVAGDQVREFGDVSTTRAR